MLTGKEGGIHSLLAHADVNVLTYETSQSLAAAEPFLKHTSKLKCRAADKLLSVETLFAKSTAYLKP